MKDPSEPSRSPLARWSPKYKAILENIEALPGSSLVYSQFLGMEGIGIFTIVMKANGYVPIKVVSRGGEFEFDEETLASIRKGPAADEKRFILFTGGEEEEVRKTNIDIFNAKYGELPTKIRDALLSSGFTNEVGNKRGELCRVFCITAAGAEGLSLKNVRGVHIMEPYWNDVRMAQVKGRAIRICSHKALEQSERNVTVYTYLATFSDLVQVISSNDRITDPKLKEEQGKEEAKLKEWTLPYEIVSSESEKISVEDAKSLGLQISDDILSTYYITTDVALANLGALKKKTSDRIQKLMKTGAVDCELNYNENQDGTFTCIKFEEKIGEGGDFLYHPSLKEDIVRWTKQQFAKVDVQALEAKKETYDKVKIAGQVYILKPSRDTTGKITHYDIYPSGLTEFTEEVKWGTVNANAEGKVIQKKEAFHKKK